MANPATARKTGASAPREYCAESNAGESLWGTADSVDVWLCLEYKTAWKARAITDNALAEPTRRWLDDTLEALAAAGLRARPQFIRQPVLDREDTRLLVAHGGRGYQLGGSGYGFLAGLDLPALLDDPERMKAQSRELTQTHYLVCTNGQRDLCCARFGRPTYTALTEQVHERAWQTTHLGGHRFAPNVLTLPDGILYGRVQADGIDEFLGHTEAGQIDFARLRGRTCYPPVVQAAEASLAVQGLRLLHVAGDEDHATVRFAAERGERSATVQRADTPLEVLKSCGDESPAEVFPFVRV
jgi:hypothetical protein